MDISTQSVVVYEEEAVGLQFKSANYYVQDSNYYDYNKANIVVNICGPLLLHLVQVENQAQDHANDGLSRLEEN